MITKDTATRLAYMADPAAPLPDQMRLANTVFTANAGDWNTPFSEVDIVQADYMQFLRTKATPRERALVIVQELLSRMWTVWHIGVQSLGEGLKPLDSTQTQVLHAALTKLDLCHLLTLKLTPKTMAKLKECLLPKKNGPGRPAKHANAAQRQRAYRDRKAIRTQEVAA